MESGIKVVKISDLEFSADGKIFTLESISNVVQANEYELTELSDRGEKLLNENEYHLNLIAEAKKLGIKTVEQVAEETRIEQAESEE